MDTITKLSLATFFLTFAALGILPRLLAKPLSRLIQRREIVVK